MSDHYLKLLLIEIPALLAGPIVLIFGGADEFCSSWVSISTRTLAGINGSLYNIRDFYLTLDVIKSKTPRHDPSNIKYSASMCVYQVSAMMVVARRGTKRASQFLPSSTYSSSLLNNAWLCLCLHFYCHTLVCLLRGVSLFQEISLWFLWLLQLQPRGLPCFFICIYSTALLLLAPRRSCHCTVLLSAVCLCMRSRAPEGSSV